MKEVKIKYVIAVVVAVLNLVFYGGWKASRASYESVSDQIIASQTSLMDTYEYRVNELERTVAQKESVIASQRALIHEGVLAKEELKALKIKHLSEITKLSTELDIMLDSIKHTGVISEPCPEEDYMPALYLPFRFREVNKYLNMTGEFDEEGIMSLNLSVPTNIDVYVGRDSRTDAYKAVVTTDNPYLKISDMVTVKTDIPESPPSRWGIGVTGGLGIPLGGQHPGVFVGVGLTYSLVRFN